MGLSGKNILVTGGTGFLGGHLVKRLIDLGCHVFVTDLLIRPKSFYLQQVLESKVIFEFGNVTNFDFIQNVIVKNEINLIFHLAAAATVDSAYYNPRGAVVTNVIGTTNILEASRQFELVEGVIVTSTDKAYGKLPRVDEKMPISGDHPYEVSKSSADLIARAYFKNYGLPVVVTRFGNVYGEGDLNFNRIIPGIMKSLLQNSILDIRSNGKFIRDYVYVEDIIDATITLAKNINRSKGQAYNVSSNENLSVLELINKVGEVLNENINYKIISKAKNEIPVQSVNFNKIKKSFGWKPQHSLKSSLPEIFEWYRNYFI